MLSFEDLIKHLCHDCDVREIFSFASRLSIHSFHRSFPAEIYQYQLDVLFFPLLVLLLLTAPRSVVGILFFAITYRILLGFNFRCFRASPAYRTTLETDYDLV